MRQLNNKPLNLCWVLGRNIYLLPTVPVTLIQTDIQARLSLMKKPLTTVIQELASASYSPKLMSFRSLWTYALTKISRCISSSLVQVAPVNLKLLHGYTISFMIKSSIYRFYAKSWIAFCPNNNQEKYLIARQVEPYVEHCHVSWTQPCRTLEFVFPRTVVERHQTVRSHGLAEYQVKHFFPWNDTEFQKHFPHGITSAWFEGISEYCSHGNSCTTGQSQSEVPFHELQKTCNFWTCVTCH